MYFSSADLLLWTRCHRQWVTFCCAGSERVPALPADMIGEATLREQARVIAEHTVRTAPHAVNVHARCRGETGTPPVADAAVVVLDTAETDRWIAATIDVIQEKKEFVHGLFPADGVAVLVDHGVFHEKVGAWEFSLVRPATGIRGIYYTETTLVALAAERNGVPLAGIHLRYLRKNARLEDGSAENLGNLYTESNLLRRARKGMDELARELVLLASPDTAAGTVDREYRCKPGCDICRPRDGHRRDRFSVHSLHKGGEVVRRLVAQGISDIRNIPSDFSDLTRKQRIQVESVVGNSVYVQREKLHSFISSLEYPLFFLDFEAFAMSLPLYEGLVPYGHTPVIASIQKQESPTEDPQAASYIARPGVDERNLLFSWIVDTVGTTGSIVVFSKTFEAAMVRQVSERADRKEDGILLERRMVDLLVPFSEFWIYHPDQRGKVSLKRVLPAFCEIAGYDDEAVQDGMHANLGYIRLTDRRNIADANAPASVISGAQAAEGVNTLLDRYPAAALTTLPTVHEIAAYCAVDTLAMFHLIRRLAAIASHEKSSAI